MKSQASRFLLASAAGKGAAVGAAAGITVGGARGLSDSDGQREWIPMSETVKLVFMILLTIGAFILSRRFAGWKMNKAVEFIIRDLKEKKAFDAASAVVLPYCKNRMFRFGLRDYRPRAMQQLVKHDMVRMLEGERYYLCEGRKLSEKDDSAYS
jgi:hypothetical protein